MLKAIRDLENQKGFPLEGRAKIVMTTALAETQIVQRAFDIGCDAYAEKPINPEKFIEVLRNLGMVD
ncbi:hypothetical protein N752_08115 [Desulforamulus aquiferis]|nr:hypothetical protein N752_08115 [Desulforamulus aquiferis]